MAELWMVATPVGDWSGADSPFDGAIGDPPGPAARAAAGEDGSPGRDGPRGHPRREAVRVAAAVPASGDLGTAHAIATPSGGGRSMPLDADRPGSMTGAPSAPEEVFASTPSASTTVAPIVPIVSSVPSPAGSTAVRPFTTDPTGLPAVSSMSPAVTEQSAPTPPDPPGDESTTARPPSETFETGVPTLGATPATGDESPAGAG